MELKVYVGMHIFFTRSVRKDIDYVKGMRATVESYEVVRKVVRCCGAMLLG